MSLPAGSPRDEGPFPLELVLPSLVDELESTIGVLRASLRLLRSSSPSDGGSELLAIASRQVERQEAVLRDIVAQLGAELEWCRRNGPAPDEPSDAPRALGAAAAIVRALAPRASIDVRDAPPSEDLRVRCALLPLTRAAHCLLVAALARSADDSVSAAARRSGELVAIEVAFLPRAGAGSTEPAGRGPLRGSSPAGLEACASLAGRCGGRVSLTDGGRRLLLEVPGA